VRFGEVKFETTGEEHRFEAQVYLNGIEPDAVRVELFAEDAAEGMVIRMEMARGPQLVGAHAWLYQATVPASRPAADFTARIIPCHPGAAVPLEAPWILWQR
jgi:starch phosphorylase